VEIKVPRQGFVLVQPHSSEEERLRECWLTPDRPNRFVVPYTYIEACKISGKLLKQIFIEEDNQPIRMHVHASIANPNARSLLRSRIMVCSIDFSLQTQFGFYCSILADIQILPCAIRV